MLTAEFILDLLILTYCRTSDCDFAKEGLALGVLHEHTPCPEASIPQTVTAVDVLQPATETQECDCYSEVCVLGLR